MRGRVLGTLLHEAAHGVASTRGIKDTSRQGRYHNRRFAQLATELGIVVAPDGARGWSATTPPHHPRAARHGRASRSPSALGVITFCYVTSKMLKT